MGKSLMGNNLALLRRNWSAGASDPWMCQAVCAVRAFVTAMGSTIRIPAPRTRLMLGMCSTRI